MLLLLLSSFFLAVLPQVEPAPVNFWHLLWSTIVPIIAGIYEAVIRIIPSIPIKYSFLAKIIEILLWLSNFLNNKKKK